MKDTPTMKVSKWERKNLTYRISKYPESLNPTAVDEEIRRALALWSEYTDLTFSLKNGTVDIEIRFERGVHGDGMPFDESQGETLAHGFYHWVGGDVHFDEDEEWIMNSNHGTNLFQVAAHEYGHSLGLGHSMIKSAVMTPAYKSYDRNFALDRADIISVQAIYGPRTTEKVPQLCADPQIATIFKTHRGHTYAFKGKYYWRLTADGIASGYPKLIARRWNRLPGDIDAVVTQKSGSTFFFKGSKYWRYIGEPSGRKLPEENKQRF